MKRAVLYARVSSELQKKEKTVDSQVLELKKQIAHDGNTLIKEYVDEGYSGAQLDRPAMDELRNDLKLDLFDTIYVLNTDRIAREVTYQTIIIAEILKYRKQIIINGKDYEHNPENKFALTVLGAVAELERAKITERSTRGKALKLAQGLLTGPGHNMFGYDYVCKTPTKEAHFVINEREASTVRTIFNEFTTSSTSMHLLAQKIKEAGHLTKKGTNNWDSGNIAKVLRNTAYTGTLYLNKVQVTTEYANPMYGTVKTSKKTIYRDKSEWVGIPIPPIISKELFEKTKEHITTVIKVRPPSPPKIEQFSGIIFCGSCGEEYHTTKRTCKRPLLRDPNNCYTLIEYVCKSRLRRKSDRCQTKQISEPVLKNRLQELCITDVKKVIHYEDDRLTIYGSVEGKEFKAESSITSNDRHKTRLLISEKIRPPKLEGRSYAGGKVFGYDYIKKSKISQAKLVINEREAYLVRDIFNRYTGKERVSLREIARHFTNEGYISKNGRNVWNLGTISEILNNETYMGIRYFKNKNKAQIAEVKVPQIISKEIFDKAKKRFKENVETRPQTKYQLLSGLITCGMCGSNYYGYTQLHRRAIKSNPGNVYNTSGYRCKKASNKEHVLNKGMRCLNTQARSHMLEGKVWDMVKTELTIPKILKTKVTNFDQLLLSQDDKKLDLSIQNYCFSLSAEIERSNAFESKRELLLKYIKKLVLFSNKVVLFGTVEISEINKLEFQVEREIIGKDRSRWGYQNKC